MEECGERSRRGKGGRVGGGGGRGTPLQAPALGCRIPTSAMPVPRFLVSLLPFRARDFGLRGGRSTPPLAHLQIERKGGLKVGGSTHPPTNPPPPSRSRTTHTHTHTPTACPSAATPAQLAHRLMAGPIATRRHCAHGRPPGWRRRGRGSRELAQNALRPGERVGQRCHAASPHRLRRLALLRRGLPFEHGTSGARFFCAAKDKGAGAWINVGRGH